MTVSEMIILAAAAIAIIAFGVISGIYVCNSERVIYRGNRELNIGRLMLGGMVALLSGVVVGINLTGCSTSPKPNPIPLQAEPVKAEKTTIRTWLDFFESRD